MGRPKAVSTLARCTKAAAAELFGLSTQALDHWIRSGCPVLERDESGAVVALHIGDMLAWRIERADSGGEGDREKTRLTRAQADVQETKLAELKGRLVDAERVRKAWADYVLACRAKLLSLPTRIAPLVAAAAGVDACRDLLESEVAAALTELAREGLPEHVERELADDSGAVGASAETDA